MNNEDQAWLDYRASFADVYDRSNYSSPLQSIVMRAGHRLAERKFHARDFFLEYWKSVQGRVSTLHL